MTAPLRPALQKFRTALNALYLEVEPSIANDILALANAAITEAEAYARAAAPRARPKIICLCGSTRFYEHFQRANYDETMLGNIVLSVGFYPHARKEMHHEEAGCTPEQKIALDELHKRKIDLADEVLVLNVGGYIGSSTRSEIDYAEAHGKPVRYLVAELGAGESPAAAPQMTKEELTQLHNFADDATRSALELADTLEQQKSKRIDVLLDDNCIETIKRLTPSGGEEINFGGVMGGIRLLWRAAAPAAPLKAGK